MITSKPRSYFRKRHLLFLVLALCLLLISTLAFSPSDNAVPVDQFRRHQGFVRSVVKAPIVPDGNVTGALTDIVINLDRSLDPAVEGRSLLKGNKIKITLPDDFISLGFPGGTPFTPVCSGAFPYQCNSGILLQGWPQHPIFPMFPPGSSDPVFYTVSLEGTHTIVFTALKDITPGLMLPGPGIKQIHLFALGFVNPSPGFYNIKVEAQTGPDDAWESGNGRVRIIPKIRPSINITSVFNGQGNPNTIYQQAGTDEMVGLPYDFLLWDRNGEPFTGVDVEMVNRRFALLRQGEKAVGYVFIKAPRRANGQEVSSSEPSSLVNAPISGIPTGRLTANFKTGDKVGDYKVTFGLFGGNWAVMHVTVN